VFMDIEMPFGSGFDILDQTLGMKFRVIFVTAFSQYAVQAFKFSAVDYLLKPLRISDLKEAVAKIALPDPDQSQKVNALTYNLGLADRPNPRIVLPDLTGFFVVDAHTIVRCEGERNYTRFHFADGSEALVTRTLKDYDDMLSSHGFFRIHQSHLVNLAFVKRYIRGKGGEIEMSDKSILPVARHRKDEFLSYFMQE
jgi:two-component system, LytTR family, response regulator